MRTKGLRLYAYNPSNGELKEVKVEYSDTVHLTKDERGKFSYFDPLEQKTTVDSRNIHFESLRLKNAKQRVNKWKKGFVEDLCNLKKYNPTKLSLY